MRFPSPIISETQLAWIKAQPYYKAATIEALFEVEKGPDGFRAALESLCDAAEKSSASGRFLAYFKRSRRIHRLSADSDSPGDSGSA